MTGRRGQGRVASVSPALLSWGPAVVAAAVLRGAAGTARGGGGGGGSGSIIIQDVLLNLLVSDNLYLNLAVGGLGGAAGVAGSAPTSANGGQSVVAVSSTAGTPLSDAVLYAPAGGGGGAGTSGAAGTAGAAAATGYAKMFGFTGPFSQQSAAVAGCLGGAQTGAVGVAMTFGSNFYPLTGGAGGGGVGTANTDFAGGAVIGGSWMPSIAGGLAAGGQGNNGIWMPRGLALSAAQAAAHLVLQAQAAGAVTGIWLWRRRWWWWRGRWCWRKWRNSLAIVACW